MAISAKGHRVTSATTLGFGILIMATGPDDARGNNLAYGEFLSSECVSCHRPHFSDGAIPSIIGLSTPYFVTALKDYRAGRRANPVMQNVARSLDDAQIEALAGYYGSLRKGRAEP